jgi:transcriptional regulator with XRE-family HTH domain
VADCSWQNQLDLSNETGISQRHINFIELGRSTPSRHTLLEIAQVLDVALRERNALLLSAGFAPVYSETTWNSAQMRTVTKALDRISRQHECYFCWEIWGDLTPTGEGASSFEEAHSSLVRSSFVQTKFS